MLSPVPLPLCQASLDLSRQRFVATTTDSRFSSFLRAPESLTGGPARESVRSTSVHRRYSSADLAGEGNMSLSPTFTAAPPVQIGGFRLLLVNLGLGGDPREFSEARATLFRLSLAGSPRVGLWYLNFSLLLSQIPEIYSKNARYYGGFEALQSGLPVCSGLSVVGLPWCRFTSPAGSDAQLPYPRSKGPCLHEESPWEVTKLSGYRNPDVLQPLGAHHGICDPFLGALGEGSLVEPLWERAI